VDDVVQWLLAGDPAIRWLVQRDLVASAPDAVARERAQIAATGWGAGLLAQQAPNGRWAAEEGPAADRGMYVPKWTSTTYTLLLLTRLGLAPDHPQAAAGCRALVEGAHWLPSGGLALWLVPREDMCVDAMVLRILEYFDYPAAELRDRLRRRILGARFADGGWNCRVDDSHSSFNTTLAALEALQPHAADPGIGPALAAGREFLLAHRLFRSHRTGQVVSAAFTRLRIPVGWQYDVLRALDHFVEAGASYDPRLDDALELIARRRRPDGRWMAARPQPGALHFELETPGEPSRWVTAHCLRALRALGGRP
jgi:hypothetical protein